MKSKKLSVYITLWTSRLVFLLMVVLPFLLPAILEWYAGFRHITIAERHTVTVCFIISAIIICWSMWNMDSILRSILRGEVFTRKNVRALRHVQWSCALVAVLCLVATFAYLPLVFLTVIMSFLFLALCVMSNVMAAAVEIREENDLTI
jgi:hypothetical protein